MKEIKEDYVSFEVAKLLDEKGFNEPCETSYYTSNVGCENVVSVGDFTKVRPYRVGLIAAPTHQMAMKWLRDVHHIYVKISFRFCCNADDDIEYCYDVWKHTDKYVVGQHYSDGGFMSNEEAVEAALKYCLTNLI